jgi:hypothetical protein
MICKYCKQTGHVIDHCPTIICLNCNKKGHPRWLCSSNPEQRKENSGGRRRRRRGGNAERDRERGFERDFPRLGGTGGARSASVEQVERWPRPAPPAAAPAAAPAPLEGELLAVLDMYDGREWF